MQRYVTNLVWEGEKLNYEERLKRLGLMRLDGRRVRSDLIDAFKMIAGYYDVTLDIFFLHLTMLEEVTAKSCLKEVD